ncbi:sigma-54-dependent Fis family transcriptional regulator [Sphingomonas gilva]|uniref:Sigma-54-dependent Fis family transcriptional regulator n=1 Tax=Sphingomonas gilva TaxID=2305907 RepID=A0A396RV57_9SPHN|nr:sigma-54 dependent transcriptional regulator [Sphingomonas gilva]RHW17561.1 sigma-54-dependent Fis family transcriptional regulator [Sphingomonas gilva]
MIEDIPQAVIFVDDDPELREANVQALQLAGLEVRPFADARSALAAIEASFAGMVVSDIRMPGMDGLELFAQIRAIDPDIPVILISGHADVPMAVGALREGAFDFLAKPFAADHLIAACERALQTRRLVLENRALRAAASAAADSDSPLIGDSPVMARLRDTIAQVAKADIDVLIEGETGSGKELVALLLHRQGPRRGRPFVAVNSGALPETLAEAELFGHERGAVAHGRLEQTGRIQSSNGGTLFLDEIDSMAMGVQAKLLRVLEEREVLPLGAERPRAVDLRVVAAAKRDLQGAIAEGVFREDLFYRLNVVRLRIPPLRERRADIPQLFAHFVDQAKAQVGAPAFVMTDAVRRRLADHDWPGNVRELRNFAFSAVLGLSDGGPRPPMGSTDSLAERVDRFEAAAIEEALGHTAGDIQATMALLALPRKTLYDKMKRHGIKPDAFRARR